MKELNFSYEKVYYIHENSYSKGGRRLNFDGENLNSLTEIISMAQNGGAEDFKVSVSAEDVLIKDDVEVERRATLDRTLDDRIEKMLNYAVKDCVNPKSFIRTLEQDFVSSWVARKGDQLIPEYILLFYMSVIEFIIEDGGTGNGGQLEYLADNERRICAKIYGHGANRYLDYSNYLNYFTFNVPYDMWKDSFDNWEKTANYMLEESMSEIAPQFIIERVLPAFYLSLCYLKKPEGRVRDLYDYTFEMA